MTAKRLGRLGKGIGAIIPEAPEVVKSASRIEEIRLSDISTNPHQPRKKFNPEAMEELKQSIQENGLIQPITVREVNDGYELIAGERRLRASKEIGLESLPAHVLPVSSDVAMMELALIENVQREDLNAIEEAEAYIVLSETFDMSHEEISRKVAKKRSSITNSIRLLNLPELIIKDIRDGIFTAGHARPLLKLENEYQQLNLWRRIKEEGLSVRATEKLAKEIKPTDIKPKNVKKKSHFAVNIEDQLMHIVGTKVKLKGNQSKGSIEIQYYSQDDLTRLMEIFQSIKD